MKSPDALAVYYPLVLKRLEAFIESHKLGNDPAWQTDVMKRLSDSVTGGKLMRGCLICYSYALCSSTELKDLPSEVLDAAIAIELLQCGLLIHDDIIDQDILRRGKPAMHEQYRQLAASQHLTQAYRMGENLALCAGDMALLLAFEPLAFKKDLAQLFSRELVKVCAGQMQDAYMGASAAPPSKRTIYEVMRSKTATYSVALPLAAGAVLAGQSATQRQHLYNIGLFAGIIFQIRDDELGVFGQAESLGKPVGSDIREGKKTLLYYYLWRAASSKERQRLQGIFGNENATVADISYVRQAMRRHGIPERLRNDVAKLKQKSYEHINKLDLSSASKAELKQLVNFCAARKF